MPETATRARTRRIRAHAALWTYGWRGWLVASPLAIFITLRIMDAGGVFDPMARAAIDWAGPDLAPLYRVAFTLITLALSVGVCRYLVRRIYLALMDY